MPEFVKSRVVSVGGIGHNVGPAMNPIDALGERMPRRGIAIGILHAGFVLTGVVTTLLGPILPLLIARWSLSDARAGLFFTLQFCGNLVGIASLGALLSRRGYRLTFFLGFSFMSLGILLLVPISELVGMIATALFGYGLGLILSGTNLWVAEITRSRRAAALSVLNLAWGLGAILCPALVMFAQKEHGLLTLLVGIAAFSGLIALVLAAIDIEPRFERSENSDPEHRLEVASKRTLVVLGGLFFLYVGTEASVGGWAAVAREAYRNNVGGPVGTLANVLLVRSARRTGADPRCSPSGQRNEPCNRRADSIRDRDRPALVGQDVPERRNLGRCQRAGTFFHLSTPGRMDGRILRHTGKTFRKHPICSCGSGRSHNALAGRLHVDRSRQFTHGVVRAPGRMPDNDRSRIHASGSFRVLAGRSRCLGIQQRRIFRCQGPVSAPI